MRRGGRREGRGGGEEIGKRRRGSEGEEGRREGRVWKGERD